jgi:2-isopropylmalate synthase
VRRIKFFDTTLRDGEQSPGIALRPDDKAAIAVALEQLGVDVVEAGFAASSPGDFAGVAAVCEAVESVTVASLARTTQEDLDASGEALQGAPRSRMHVFLATSPIHMERKLGMEPAEVLEKVSWSVAYARELVDEVEFSAEDATRTDYGFLREVLQATFEAGATTLNVPDTVGYSLPHEYAELIGKLVRDVPGAIISVHCHNDLGLAVANSLAAVHAGARQVECTINGIGERAGNASLEEFVMALKVRGESLGAETGVRAELLNPTSAMLSGITGIWPQPNKAVVGRNAFAHEAGIHQHGILANPITYEIMTPASVGVKETLLVLGKHSGKHAVESRLRALGVRLSAEQVEAVTARVKELADAQKYVYDDDLLNLVGTSQVRSVRLVRFQAFSGSQVLPTATVEVEVDGETRSASAVGNGPVDAALKAADAALGIHLQLLELTTRAVTGGKDAMAEVLVRVQHDGAESSGQGASTDTIEAALKAYLSAVATARAAHEQQPSLAGERAS